MDARRSSGISQQLEELSPAEQMPLERELWPWRGADECGGLLPCPAIEDLNAGLEVEWSGTTYVEDGPDGPSAVVP